MKKKNHRFHMLLSTTYDLNNSHIKRLRMELQTINEGVFKLLLKSETMQAEFILTQSWQFLYNLNTMNEYKQR